jgi:hypothetical protein
VDFISYTESIDTSTPAGKGLFTMVSAFAEFERDLIRERIHAGRVCPLRQSAASTNSGAMVSASARSPPSWNSLSAR